MNKKQISKLCLVITGCISPNNDVPQLQLRDSKERRTQYINSIKYYLEKTNIQNIVFCDNSEAVLDGELIKIAQKYGKQFEWISFSGNSEKCIQCGKGYGEGEIIEYAMKNSKLLHASDVMLKITGRMSIRNIDRIIKLANVKRNYFYPVVQEGGKPFVCTKMFIVQKPVFKRFFVDEYNKVNDMEHNYIEHVYGGIIKNNKFSVSIIPLNPMIYGVSGTTGEVYSPKMYKQVWYTIRMHIFRR